MSANFDHGILFCDERELFYIELVYKESATQHRQWGEIIQDEVTGEQTVTLWDCNFKVSPDELLEFISQASKRLREYESEKR